MTQHSSRMILSAVIFVSLSACSLAYGRGGGGHGGSGGGAHEHGRPAEPRAQAEEHHGPEAATANHQAGNNGRENEALRHDVVNPYVHGAEANRVEANRYHAGYWNREGYWGLVDGGGEEWTTNSPPPPAPDTP